MNSLFRTATRSRRGRRRRRSSAHTSHLTSHISDLTSHTLRIPKQYLGMARLRWTVFVKFWGNRDPPELSRLLRGKANEPTKFWGNRDPPELSRLLRGKANRPTKFWGHRDPLELSRFLFGTLLPAGRSNFRGSPRANRLTKDSRSRRHRDLPLGR